MCEVRSPGEAAGPSGMMESSLIGAEEASNLATEYGPNGHAAVNVVYSFERARDGLHAARRDWLREQISG